MMKSAQSFHGSTSTLIVKPVFGCSTSLAYFEAFARQQIIDDHYFFDFVRRAGKRFTKIHDDSV